MVQTSILVAPLCSTKLMAALTVPPVASTSSIINTFESGLIASSCISIISDPYSSSYCACKVFLGNLPALRIGTNDVDSSMAKGHANMNPRDSIPAMTSNSELRYRSASYAMH